MTAENKSALVLLFTTVLAGLGWIFSKQAIQGIPPFGFVGLRFCVASLCLLPFCLRELIFIEKMNLIKAIGCGLVLALALLTWVYAISVSESLGAGAFIVSLSMLIVPIFGWLIFRETPKRIFWFSLPIALLGLALLSLSGGWQSSPGQIWFLINACLLALHFNVNSRLVKKVPVLALTTIQLGVTGCVAICGSLLFETLPAQVSGEIWVWFFLSALLATSLRYVMQTYGQKGCHPNNAALIMLLEPIWAVVLSMLVYGEELSNNKVLGCILILLSLLLYRTEGRIPRLRL